MYALFIIMSQYTLLINTERYLNRWLSLKDLKLWILKMLWEGARNPLNSWARMDSKTENGVFTFGPNDLDLAKRLCKAGSDHRKFIRQIFVTVDITAPIYWWKEYDTYKVATVANSTSTMHKIASKPFTLDDFSQSVWIHRHRRRWHIPFSVLEDLRKDYLETKG